MIYVLDSNIIIHYLREEKNVMEAIDTVIVGGCQLLIPRAINYEICRGLDLLGATKKSTVYEKITNNSGFCKIVDMGEDVWGIAKQVYVSLRRRSLTVGEIDILIASFCLCHNYTLVTANTKDFANIEGLALENWQKEAPLCTV